MRESIITSNKVKKKTNISLELEEFVSEIRKQSFPRCVSIMHMFKGEVNYLFFFFFTFDKGTLG